jgi:hypothetical protein
MELSQKELTLLKCLKDYTMELKENAVKDLWEWTEGYGHYSETLKGGLLTDKNATTYK